MDALDREIRTWLGLFAWRGARVDEASDLVLRYCRRGLPLDLLIRHLQSSIRDVVLFRDRILILHHNAILVLTEDLHYVSTTICGQWSYEQLVVNPASDRFLLLGPDGIEQVDAQGRFHKRHTSWCNAVSVDVDSANGDIYFCTSDGAYRTTYNGGSIASSIHAQIGTWNIMCIPDGGGAICWRQRDDGARGNPHTIKIMDSNLQVRSSFLARAAPMGFDSNTKTLFLHESDRVCHAVDLAGRRKFSSFVVPHQPFRVYVGSNGVPVFVSRLVLNIDLVFMDGAILKSSVPVSVSL